jgi:hypothetical protein
MTRNSLASYKATELIRKSLSQEHPVQLRGTPQKVHVQVQTDKESTISTNETVHDGQQPVYDWEVETIEEVKDALKDALKENESVSHTLKHTYILVSSMFYIALGKSG